MDFIRNGMTLFFCVTIYARQIDDAFQYLDCEYSVIQLLECSTTHKIALNVKLITADIGITYLPELTKDEPSEDNSFSNRMW